MTARFLILLFILAELSSYVGHFFSWLNTIGFFVIIAAALALSLKRLEYGLYFVLADLILGGKSGALFSFEYSGFFLSLRMALFIVVMAVWSVKAFAKVKIAPPLSPPQGGGETTQFPPLSKGRLGGVNKWWGLLGLAVAWGLIVGLARGNGFGNLFLDANGYFYAALILPFWWVFGKARGQSFLKKDCPLAVVFFTSTTLLAIKTLFAVYIFTHAGNDFIAANLIPFYRWVRDTGIGEITWLPGNFARVFFQSQIYNVLAFFALLVWYMRRSAGPYVSLGGTQGAALLVLNTAVIIISFSRSFWVGTAAGLLVIVVLIGRIGLIRQIGRIGIIIVSAVVLILAVSRFPFPRPSPMDLSAAAQSRLENEAAASSRWNLLPPLWSAIKQHPIIGSGFGATVTHTSNDPRIREISPTGEYTTYAFEWGWLDVWLKMGLMGLIGLIGLIGALGIKLYRNANLAGLAVLAVLATIHFFTPYLNHPLGIGVLLLTTLMICDIVPTVDFSKIVSNTSPQGMFNRKDK